MTWFILIGLGILYFIAFRFMQFIGQMSDQERFMEDEYQMEFLNEKQREKEKRIDQHLQYLKNGYVRRD